MNHLRQMTYAQYYALDLHWLKVTSKYLVALHILPSGLSGMLQSSWCAFQCHCDFVIPVKSCSVYKRNSERVICGNHTWKWELSNYCWNLNRLGTSRDYNCGRPDGTAVTCQIQWHWLCLLCFWHLLAFSTWFFSIHDTNTSEVRDEH